MDPTPYEPQVVLLDACVLVPSLLLDTLLRCAEVGLYRVRFSSRILDEFERHFAETLVQQAGLNTEEAAQRAAAKRGAIERAFQYDEALVTHFEALEGRMLNDPKDRHVAAAAVKAHAVLIITANLRDFRPEHLSPFGLVAKHPDDFLCELLDRYPADVVTILRKQSAAYKVREITLPDLLTYLEKSVPRFAARASELLKV